VGWQGYARLTEVPTRSRRRHQLNGSVEQHCRRPCTRSGACCPGQRTVLLCARVAFHNFMVTKLTVAADCFPSTWQRSVTWFACRTRKSIAPPYFPRFPLRPASENKVGAIRHRQLDQCMRLNRTSLAKLFCGVRLDTSIFMFRYGSLDMARMKPLTRLREHSAGSPLVLSMQPHGFEL